MTGARAARSGRPMSPDRPPPGSRDARKAIEPGGLRRQEGQPAQCRIASPPGSGAALKAKVQIGERIGVC